MPSNSPEVQRKANLKKRYGITPEDYDRLLEKQNHSCGSCGRTKPSGHGRFHVDHCHTTGKVRGLLCHHCNNGIGNLGDTYQSLQSAAYYLSQFEPTLFPGIWKRIAPKISSSISAPFDLETQRGCSDSRSLKETVPVFTVVPKTTSLSTM
jgi:hypothetical protein